MKINNFFFWDYLIFYGQPACLNLLFSRISRMMTIVFFMREEISLVVSFFLFLRWLARRRSSLASLSSCLWSQSFICVRYIVKSQRCLNDWDLHRPSNYRRGSRPVLTLIQFFFFYRYLQSKVILDIVWH